MQQEQVIQKHIGLQSKYILQAYNLTIISLSAKNRAIIDRTDTIYLYNESKNKLIKKIHLKNDYDLPSILLSTYSSKYKSLFLLLNNGKVAVFDHILNFLVIVDIPIMKHSLEIKFIDRINSFLIVKVEEVQILPIILFSNHTRKLFSSGLTYNLTPLKLISIPTKLKYKQKIIVHNQEKIIIFNQNTVEIHQFINFSQEHTQISTILISNLCQLPDCITTILLFQQRNYLLCGTSYGYLKAYKIPDNNKLIFSINIHSKPIITLQPVSNKMILSLSTDDTIQLIDLDSMQTIQKFIIQQHCRSAIFLSKQIFYTLTQNNNLYFNKISLQHRIIYNHNSLLLHSLSTDNNHILIFSDNSIITINQQNKINRSFIPPKCKQVLSLIINPYKKQRNKQFWLLTDKSQIYKYQEDQNNVIKIIEILETISFLDKFNQQCKYHVNQITFISSVPIKYDSDIKQKFYQPNYQQIYLCKPICLGCVQGTILICSSQRISQIICKICPYLTVVQCLINLQMNNKNSYLISQSCKQLVITQLSSTKQPTTIYRGIINKNSKLKKIKENLLVLIDQYYLTLLICYQNIIYNQGQFIGKHQHEIVTVSYCQQKNIIITGDKKGNIYCWNLQMKLLKKIIISQAKQIQYVAYLNQIFIIGYSQKLYTIKIKIIKQNIQFNFNNLKKLFDGIQQITKINKQLPKIQQKYSKQIFESKQFNKTKLNRTTFKKSKQYSLPSINKLQLLQSQEKKIKSKDLYKISPYYQKKKNKQKNKSYQFLFHFPNAGLYGQLIKKKIIQ